VVLNFHWVFPGKYFNNNLFKNSDMHLYRQPRLLQFFAMLFLCTALGCGKTKMSAELSEENPLTLNNSNIRLFNITQKDLGVIVNNTVLAKPPSNIMDELQVSAIGKLLFPDGIWKDKAAFSIPNTLLDKAGGAYISIPGTNGASLFRDTLLMNDPVNPKDYYLLPAGKIAAFDRNNTAPSNPQHFKIRIVNLGDLNSDFNMGGPVSLTYSDGSQVDPALNGIANGQSSQYAEIPYGAYQFKLFAGGANPDFKRQLATDRIVYAYNGCVPGILPQEGFMPPLMTFKPGGVYTIMVIPSIFNFEVSCNGSTSIRETRYANAYHVITDLDPGSNLSYARINAINTVPGKKITVTDNGRTIGEGSLSYIGDLFQQKALACHYEIVVQGQHRIQAQDESGKTLAELDIQLYPFDNITFWVRNDASGKTSIIFTSNDMTSTMYKTGIASGQAPDDGTNGEIRRRRTVYAWQSRFLNFCNELSSVSFTSDGQLFLPAYVYPDTVRPYGAYTQLAPGFVPQRSAAVIYTLYNTGNYGEDGKPDAHIPNSEASWFPKRIYVNNSEGGILPGMLMSDIPPIDCAKTYFSNDALYSVDYTRPPAENGVYSTALVGGQSGAVRKMIVIKHNK
jgi:hypothetical protein